jgi:hypothetical protein
MESARDKAVRLLLDFRRRVLLDAGVDQGAIEDERGEAVAVVDAIIAAARAPESEHTRAVQNKRGPA